MILHEPTCRFRNPMQFSPDQPTGCLHPEVFVRDRIVTEEICARCEKKKPLVPDPPRSVSWPALDAPSGTGAEGQRNCLIVLQPRAIARCLRSIDALPVDKVYFRAFTERQLVAPLNQFFQETDYDNYLLVADDVIVNRTAFEVVADLLRRHELATGYCRLSQDSSYVNLTRGPLRLRNGQIPVMEDYDFYHLEEIKHFQQPRFLSWFGGWALTGMRREVWLEMPFRVNRFSGVQSDFESSYILNRPFVTHRAAYIEHIKPKVTGICQENFLVGLETPQIMVRPYEPA